MNQELKLALLRDRRPQYVVAREAAISETRLSRIVTGRIEPTEAEKSCLARVLTRDVGDLFSTPHAREETGRSEQ